MKTATAAFDIDSETLCNIHSASEEALRRAFSTLVVHGPAIRNMDLPDTIQLCLLTIVAIFAVVAYRWTHLERPPKDGRTFRVRGVPPHWNIDELQSFLAEHDGPAGPTVKSLAHEIHARSSTGTVIFQNVSLPTARTWRISLPQPSEPSKIQPARDQHLTVDDDFLGITTLYAPPPEDHKVE